MSRLILWLAAVAALSVPGAVSVRAQTPGNLVSQVVDGSTGYQYAVPSDWQQVPVWLRQRNFDQMLTVDGQVASPDNNQHARVETGSGFGASPDKVHDTVMSFLQGPRGGAGPTFTVFANPSPVQVANADAAEAGAASYNDPTAIRASSLRDWPSAAEQPTCS